ncbi:hypothetical protein [Bianquea renquensis]|uniref:Cell division protein FtsL n=1 Tax=Bianquea renquensis TaxID=2763661 RepID=A0A926DTT7_9FIRM|nr:hypothetical protein [Bianquea renquensis]MBC8543823.1 hypothetical protein [Bianquea renquensis]
MPRELYEEEVYDYFEEAIKSQAPYSQGNLAQVPEEEPQIAPRVPETKPARKPQPKRRPRQKQDPVRVRSKINFFIMAGLVMLGTLSIAVMYTQVFNRKAQIQALQSDLAQTQQDTVIMREENQTGMTLEELYQYAVNELGMVPADKQSTVYLPLDGKSYTNQVGEVEKESASRVTFHWFG